MYLLDDGQQPSGTICLANETRFNATFLSEPLTAYSAGWKDPQDLQGLLDFIAPPVPVGRRFEFRRADNAQAFLSEVDDVRAIGSAFKRVDYTGEMVQAKTLNKGLTLRVDHDEAVGDDWQERYTQILIQRLLRNELRRAIAALDSADTQDTKVWSPLSDTTANPDGDLRAALSASATSSGVRPNRVIYGEGAWDIRANAYDIQNRAGANRQAGLSLEQLARHLFVDEIRLVSTRYQSSETAKTAVLASTIYAYYAQDGLLKDEPSNLKRFYTPVDGTAFRVYVQPHAKFTDLTVEHYSNLVVTSTVGIRKIVVSAS